MIRYSSSFLVSILIHVVLFFTLFFLNNNNVKKKVTTCEQKISIKLNNYTSSHKQAKKPKVVKKEIKKDTKLVKKKRVLKTKPKPTQKPEPKQKLKVEKVESTIPIISNITTIEKQETVEEFQEKKMPSKEYVTKVYIQDNIAKIVRLLQENLYYPRRARKKGITGEVIVKFTLELDSSVNNIKVIRSNKEILSRAAIKTIQNLSKKFPAPKEQLNIEVPISYSLN
jgi:protein TonB